MGVIARSATALPPVKSISDLAEWMQAQNNGLRLPPIQRSVVWKNEQIINYWDSLLRGFPPGTMIVHRVIGVGNKGRDANDVTRESEAGDFQLFDGQQRMATVLLGLGKGSLMTTRKLWVDFGVNPAKDSGLRFQLRLSSTGQPFGYQPDHPNQKIVLRERQNKWGEWKKAWGESESPQQAFGKVVGGDLINATCATAFAEVCELLSSEGREKAISTLSVRPGAIAEIVANFVSALEAALSSRVMLQELGLEIVSREDEYVRFFERLGQGGTPLSNDELTYSIIKYHYPKVHDRMKSIMQGEAGRLAGEVDLVLGALRAAKAIATWDAKEWERISRPSPTFVTQLSRNEAVRKRFEDMILADRQPTLFEKALVQVRGALSYNRELNPRGLPAMLLARLPAELVDVLILFAVRRGVSKSWSGEESVILQAFVLYWMLFVEDNGKAAWRAYQHGAEKDWVYSRSGVCNLVGEYEEEGISYYIPRRAMLPVLTHEIEKGDHLLRAGADRFSAADRGSERKPGEALRVLSTNSELIKRALLWLQRDFLVSQFPYYDPTSDRDEDLPIDLDHIVPNDIFGCDWRTCKKRLKKDAITATFRWGRNVVGNSLGNFRWLSSSDNRSRGKGAFIPLDNGADLVERPDDWMPLIPIDKREPAWSKDDIATFQRVIDQRTLFLYERILLGSGIEDLLPVA